MTGFAQGTLVRGMGGLYTARTDDGLEYVLRAKKKFRRQRVTPLVGDRVLFTPGEISDEHGWVEEILPRANQFVRPPVANVTLLCVTVSPVPEPDCLLVDKLLVFAQMQDLTAVLVVNKNDLDGGETAARLAAAYERAGVKVFDVSASSGWGLKELKERLRGESACFSGQSGVGKSSLLNALFSVRAQTGEISEKISRGKNTTRHTELFEADGCRVYDTPGFSLLEIGEPLDPVMVQEWYPEMRSLRDQCRFEGCCHVSEPGCAVREAAQKGNIDMGRYTRYTILLEDAREVWKNRYR
ncbi:MAG: ribosome small subunit-dependent GTPase A [Clostridia bacterium]|nr:ribosome small subunit-dependent GTPase A [Clostridia bacterium]